MCNVRVQTWWTELFLNPTLEEGTPPWLICKAVCKLYSKNHSLVSKKVGVGSKSKLWGSRPAWAPGLWLLQPLSHLCRPGLPLCFTQKHRRGPPPVQPQFQGSRHFFSGKQPEMLSPRASLGHTWLTEGKVTPATDRAAQISGKEWGEGGARYSTELTHTAVNHANKCASCENFLKGILIFKIPKFEK